MWIFSTDEVIKAVHKNKMLRKYLMTKILDTLIPDDRLLRVYVFGFFFLSQKYV